MSKMSNRRAPVVTVALTAGLAAAGCERAADADGSEGAGFEAALWETEEVVRIGSLDDPEQALTSVGTVVVGPDETLYVGQPSDQEIRVYDRTGDLVRIIGGEGEGPEEFLSVRALGRVGDVLFVVDGGNGRVSFISWEGEFLRSHRWEGEMANLEQNGQSFFASWTSPLAAVPVEDGGFLVEPNSGFPLTSEMRDADVWEMTVPRPLLWLDEQGTVIDTVAWERRETVTVRLERGGQRYGFSAPFPDWPIHELSPVGSGVVEVERREAPADARDGRFEVRLLKAGGDTAWARDYPYSPQPVTEEDLRRELDPREPPPGDDPDPPSADERLAELERRGFVRQHMPPVTEVAVAQDGTVWLRREDTGAETVGWDVLSGEDGEPVGRVHLAADQEVLTAADDLLVVQEEDAFGVPYVVGYRLTRP